jgi:hypothetical protein
MHKVMHFTLISIMTALLANSVLTIRTLLIT